MSSQRPPLPYFSTDRTQELWKVLQFDNRLIAFYRPLVDVLHSVKATVYLSQMIFWTRIGRDIDQNDGWFYKTADEFAVETGLSKWEQETARKNLKSMGLIQTKMQGLPGAPLPAKPWYRVNLDGLSIVLSQALKISAAPLSLADLRLNTPNLTEYLSKPIMYHTGLAKIADGVNAGLMLTCFVYSYQRGYNQQKFKGFVSRNIKVWQKETGLTYDEQINARRLLLSKGLIVERHLTASRNIFTEINFAKCCDLLLSLNTKEDKKENQKSYEKRALLYAEKGVRSYGETPNTGTAKPQIQVQQYPKYSYGDSQNKAMAEPEIPKEQNTEVPEYGFSDNSFISLPPQETVPSSAKDGETKPSVVVSDEIQINQWVWPKCFTDEQDKRIAAQKLMCLPKMAQELLDEMAGNERAGKTVTKPVRYLDRLIGLVQSGTFIAEVAHKIKAGREQQVAQYSQNMVRRQEIVDYERRMEEKRLKNVMARREKRV